MQKPRLSGVSATVECCPNCSGPNVKMASRAVAETQTFLVYVLDSTARVIVAPDLGHMNRAHMFPSAASCVTHALGPLSTRQLVHGGLASPE